MDSRIQNLTFGVELELYLPTGMSRVDAAERLSRAIGKPVKCEGYNHVDGNYWKVVSDASVTGGWEFVSPILKGQAGLDELKLAMDTLVAMGCTVTTSCGTHVHVGAGRREPDLNMLKRLIKAYLLFETEIDTVIQQSRRANNCWAARTLTNVSLARIDAAPDQMSLIRLFGPIGNARFHKVNLESLYRHTTIEFRQHGGTLEFEKISKWLHFMLRLMAAAIDGSIAAGTNPSTSNAGQVNQARYGSKSYQIGQLLLRPEGCTPAEAMAAVGWPSVSMQSQARICGLSIVGQRFGRSMRFWARAVNPTTSTEIANGPVTLDRLLEIIGSTSEDREYFRARAAHFARRTTRAAA